MFLVPSRSRVVDPYLQTLLLRVSLIRLGGKHRQLVRQVGDSASSPTNSMAGPSNANGVPEGTTFIFGSWACTADGTGGFSSHLVTPNSPKLKTHSQLADIRESADLGEKRVPPELNSDNPETCQLRPELSVQSSSTQTPIPKNLTFPKPLEKVERLALRDRSGEFKAHRLHQDS